MNGTPRLSALRKKSVVGAVAVSLFVTLVSGAPTTFASQRPECNAALEKELLGQQRLREAQEVLFAATRACPDMAELFDTLGLAYDFNNQSAEAQKAFGKAVALNPQNNLFRNNLATSYLRAGNQSAGIAEFQTVLGADPSNKTAGLNLGTFYLREKQYKLAIRYFQAVGVEQFQDPISLLELTEAQFGAGEVQSWTRRCTFPAWRAWMQEFTFP